MIFKWDADGFPEEVLSVPSVFIREYMPKANPAYSVVYLYCLSYVEKGQAALGVEQIAADLNMLEGDVLRCFSYWKEKGLLSYDAARDELMFTFPKEQETFPKQLELRQQPQYSPAELAIYIEKSEAVKELFASAQSHLGRLLSVAEMSVLFGFYDCLGLPMEVIELLLGYCTHNGHRSLTYIERVAIEWAEKGICTVEKAKAQMKLYGDGYMRVMKAFGLGNRTPSKTEMGYLKKWLEDYRMPMELIEAACDKTVMSTSKASFPYADKIIESWYAEGVRTVEEAKKQKEAYHAAKKEKPASLKAKPEQKQNRFVNYEQRDWDFAELEKLERERIRRNLGK